MAIQETALWRDGSYSEDHLTIDAVSQKWSEENKTSCEDEEKIRHEEVDLHGILNRLWIYQIF
jgi:hypothetical protein